MVALPDEGDICPDPRFHLGEGPQGTDLLSKIDSRRLPAPGGRPIIDGVAVEGSVGLRLLPPLESLGPKTFR